MSPRQWQLGVAASLCAALLLFEASASGGMSGPLVPVGVLSGLIALYPMYRLTTKLEADPFAPVQLFVLYLAITVHVRAIVIRTGNSGILTPLYDTGGPEVAWLLTLALASTGLFLVFLYLGYYGGLAERMCAPLPRFGGPAGTSTEVRVGVVLAAVIATPIAILLWTRIGASVAGGRFTDETRAGGVFWMGYLLRFAVFGSLLPYFAALRDGGRWKVARWAAIALGVALLVFVLFPKKIVVANQLLIMLVGYHYLRRRISVRALVASGCAALLALPLLSQFRYAGFAGFTPSRLLVLGRAIVEAPALLLQVIFLRTFGADSLVLIFDKLRVTHEYALGSTMREALWWYVPRGLWPEKPLTYAITFGQEFLNRSSFFSVNVSGTPTVVGELILNFGVPGLVAGGLMVGVFLRLPYAYLVKRNASFGAVMLYGTFLAGSVMLVEGPIEPQLMDMFISVAFVGVLLGAMEGARWASQVWHRQPVSTLADARRD